MRSIIHNRITYTMPDQIVLIERDILPWRAYYGEVLNIKIDRSIPLRPKFKAFGKNIRDLFFFPEETLTVKYLTPKQFNELKTFL
jgi:hypothetical protein